MDTAWWAYLIGAAAGFVTLETYAIVRGKSTLTQFLRRKLGVQPLHWSWRVWSALVGSGLAWLWIHLFTKWL